MWVNFGLSAILVSDSELCQSVVILWLFYLKEKKYEIFNLCFLHPPPMQMLRIQKNRTQIEKSLNKMTRIGTIMEESNIDRKNPRKFDTKLSYLCKQTDIFAMWSTPCCVLQHLVWLWPGLTLTESDSGNARRCVIQCHVRLWAVAQLRNRFYIIAIIRVEEGFI